MPKYINKIAVIAIVAVILLIIRASNKKITIPLDTATPQNVTLSGTYVCLPFIDSKTPISSECVFGLQTDDGLYYMVNFGQSASAMEEFQKGAHIVADGFYVYKESLNTDQWQKYNMKGIFTITNKITSSIPVPTPNPKSVSCTDEAKLCPNGSYVSRSGPRCEFAQCPKINPPLTICDYAGPPKGCSYIPGPDYNPESMCGMVLKC